MTISDKRRFVFLPVVLLCVVFFFGRYSVYADNDDKAIARRLALSGKLDSLELQKQMLKRNGEPLGDIEEQCRTIRDSLATIRIEIAGTDEPVRYVREEAPKPDSFLSSLLKPATMFDWGIVILGGVALLSIIILLLGLLRGVNRGAKPGKRPVRSPAPKKAGSLKPERDSREISSAEPAVSTDKDTGGIEALRLRMHKDIDDIQRFNRSISPFSGKDGAPAPHAEPENGNTIRQTIIHAARQGLSTAEISRQYHVSVDQVSLILRVAEKGRAAEE